MPATPLSEIAGLFLRLGVTAFGGPAAHIAMMKEEVVSRRRWLTEEEFLDYLGATNLIPGPNSTELAIHIGHIRAGWRGLIVAGACFILPAALIVGLLADLYVRYSMVPDVGRMLYGIKPVVIAIVATAVWSLGATLFKSAVSAIVAAGAAIGILAGVHELIVLPVSALASLIARQPARLRGANLLAVLPLLPGPLASASAAPFALWPMFLLFAKIGSVLFGSGYVLIAFLRADLVTRLGWLTEQQLLDAVAAGQVTPGPLFTTATFIGYVLGGGWGAAVATLGIFLPAFVFVAASSPLIPRIRRSPTAGAMLDGVNAASLALMAVVLGQLARAAIVDVATAVLAVGSLVALLVFRVGSVWLVAFGAAIGYLARIVRF